MKWLLLAVAVIVAASALLAPPFPYNDSALFEYYGRAITRGAQLYRDLYDVKPPSIYYANALFQLAFGENYLAQNLLLALLNGGSALLFALLGRELGAPSWATGTLLFILAISFGGQLDIVQNYAVFFVLLGYLLAARGRPLAAGAALLLASSFLVQAVILLGPLLLRQKGGRRRMIGGYVAAAAIYYLLFALLLGVGWPLGMVLGWRNDLAGTIDIGRIPQTFAHSVATTALLTLALLSAVAAHRPLDDSKRFALRWVVFAFAAALIPPRLFTVYFIPVIPALAMTVSAFGLSLTQFRQRWLLGGLSLVMIAYVARECVLTERAGRDYASLAHAVGLWIEQSAGPGSVVVTQSYLPEIYLAADARVTGKQGIMANVLQPAAEGYSVADADRGPQIVVLGALGITRPPRPTSLLVDGTVFARVCPTFDLATFTVLALPGLAQRFPCPR